MVGLRASNSVIFGNLICLTYADSELFSSSLFSPRISYNDNTNNNRLNKQIKSKNKKQYIYIYILQIYSKYAII